MATPLDTLKRLRKLFPTPMSKVQLGSLLNEAAWIHRSEGYVLLGKKSGNNCPQPRTGVKISCDYLVHGPTKRGYDCLQDSEGAATPRWPSPEDMTGQIASGSRTLVPAVEPITSEPPPPDPPPPDPPPPDPPPPDPPPPPSDVEIRLRALELQLDDLEDRLTMLASRPYPTYRGSLFGIPITSHPVE